MEETTGWWEGSHLDKLMKHPEGSLSFSLNLTLIHSALGVPQHFHITLPSPPSGGLASPGVWGVA